MPTSCASALAAAITTLLSAAVLLCAGTGLASDELERRAHLFRSALVERHLAPEGIVLYRVDLRTIERDLVSGTYPNLADAPTFTGLFAAASCSRARIELDPSEALADADRALAGLALLMAVTGRRGLLARSARRDRGRDVSDLRGKWLPAAPPHERYVFRADVSVDQYANGLLPAVAACAHAFPARARELATAFAEHLLEHDLQLIDADGERTRFGDLSWTSGFGFNSIYQLTAYTAFALAAELDRDPRWATERDRLRERYRVPARARTTNLRVGALTNHSNDLMIWNLYRVLVPLARRSADPALADLRHGMLRSWLRVREDDNAYFATILCYVEIESCDRRALAHARGQLGRFPTDRRKLEPDARLASLSRRLLPGRKGKPLARRVVPIELRPASSLEWKSSPYRLTGVTQPHIEYTGVDFLVAYWLLRLVETDPALRPPAPEQASGPRGAPAEPGPTSSRR